MARLIEDLLQYAKLSAVAAHPLETIDANIELRAAVENLASAVEA